MDRHDLNLQQLLLHQMGIHRILALKSPDNDQVRPAIEDAACSDFSSAADVRSTPQIQIPPQLFRFRKPAYSVWSYHQLSLDICRGFTNPRSELINEMIRALRWDPGKYTFWPMTSMDPDCFDSNIELFNLGLQSICPVYVFIFGPKAFQTMFPGQEYVYGPKTYKDFQVIVLPDLDTLLPDNRILKNLIWFHLKRVSPTTY